ncbi:MAG: xanthine dehydrogenase family protein molybdopterin-binding subunit [Nitrospinota bacterium]
MQPLSVVGKGVPRIDGPAKATGEMEFLSDLQLPGMLHARILRSPHSHARILKIDTSRAKRAGGVKAVITAADTPKIPFGFVTALADKLPLCEDRVRFVGDEVAAVAADSEEAAEEALSLIEVEFEELPAVYDPGEAMAEGAPHLHEGKERNVAWEIHKKFGDPEKGFAESDHVLEDAFSTQRAAHCALESRACIARLERTGADSRLTLWASTQAPHTLKEEVARTLGLDVRRIRVIKPATGGAFGNRMVMEMGAPIAAILARETARPVKLANTRTDEFEVSRTRYPYHIELKTGFRSDGRLVARSIRILVDSGAYADKGGATLSFSGSMFAVLYNVPHIQYDGYIVYTNRQPGTAFRGFGNPQITFAAESQMDRIAGFLKMDPLELRRINANRAGETSASGVRLSECSLETCLDQVAEAAGWAAHRARRAGSRQEGGRFRRGMGLAVMIHSGGGSRYYGYNSAGSFINVSRDGQVILTTPANDTGQGALTVMAQVAAEELGVRMEDIRVVSDDTDIVPYDLGNFGSRTTWVCGQAARAAAAQARRQVLSAVAEAWEVSPEDLEAADSEIRVAGHPERSMTFREAASLIYDKRGAPVTAEGRFEDAVAAGHVDWSNQIPNYSTGCHLVEVEVDEETGKVEILRFFAAHDVGRAVNRRGAEGQVEGAVGQGIGYALFEELAQDRGVAVNPSFIDYKIPCALDVPVPDTFLVEDADSQGPLYGAKGVGEPGLVPTAAAVANAIADATGVRLYELPMNPERVYKALKEWGRRRELQKVGKQS